MLIDKILEECDFLYNTSCAGKCGNICNNIDYCKGSCDAEGGCLDQVHWYPETSGRTDYNCEHLLEKYVLRYTEKYKAQIISAMNHVDISRFRQFEVFSIGCGAAPDLMAFEELTNTAGTPIYYRGFDKNELWRPIHESIMNYAGKTRGMDVLLMQEDIFHVLTTQKPSHQYNTVVMQYVLSHLYNTHQERRTYELYDLIISRILPLRDKSVPFIILLCDVDSVNKGRNTWFSLIDKLEQNHYYGKAFAMSFYQKSDLGQERWSRYKESPLFGNISYQFFQNESEHDSAKLIIELE